ncbi:hypothetical protein PAXRUDRAFT_829567 [Paxillus rubicundulus Ve08.2h10]|uniref:Uncharacterized protein n=1 Tax=Paxillus rubicundulus Ve08.2h10 TaxID=930991 RepID=A0A0D0D7K1_9AGAM|nr:hypothetical protein PAXRUDRAFT_829567 [Paxillus rubicundulus Ve08.2h10]
MGNMGLDGQICLSNGSNIERANTQYSVGGETTGSVVTLTTAVRKTLNITSY